MNVTYKGLPYRVIVHAATHDRGLVTTVLGRNDGQEGRQAGWQRAMNAIESAMKDGKHIVKAELRRVESKEKYPRAGDVYDVLDIEVRECAVGEQGKVLVAGDLSAKL